VKLAKLGSFPVAGRVGKLKLLQFLEGTQGEATMLVEDTYVRSDAVVSRLIGGETLVVPVRGGVGDLASIYSFNEVGTLIWEALARPISLQGLVELIEREYLVSRSQAVQDVVPFLSDVFAAGLVARVDAPEQARGTDGWATMEPGWISR
jgi:hypothetical protein